MIMLVAVLLGCRPDLGAPSYPTPKRWGEDTAGGDLLPGPDPYVDGEARLSLGAFYESGCSDLDLFDNLYIYSNTFTISTSADRVEGTISDVWTHTGNAWWGGGLHWDSARDLSAWNTLNIDLMAPAEGGISAVDLAMTGGSEGRVAASDVGFAADGEWHHLVVDLADFQSAGTDLTQVTIPLVLVGEGGAEGDDLFIDNLYLE